MKKIIPFFMLVAAGFVQSQPIGGEASELRTLVSLFVGEFSNAQQVSMQRNSAYSALYHRRVRIDSESLDGYWVYAQLNREARNGEVYRQTYYQFFIDDEGLIKSRVYKLINSEAQPKDFPSKEFLQSLDITQLNPMLGDGCNTKWRREIDQFIGLTDYNTCVIDSKYQDEQRRLFAEEILAVTGMWGREGAYKMNGRLAFGLEAPNYYQFQRVLKGGSE